MIPTKTRLVKFCVLLLLFACLLTGLLPLSDKLNAQALAADRAQFPTGNFRLRSYLRQSHPKFVEKNQGIRSLALPETNCNPIVSGKIYRFIEGVDQCVIPMTDQDIKNELNDKFAINLLRKGTFPTSVDDISNMVAMSDANLQESNYMVGEGSQIPITIATREKQRNLRYVLTWGEKNQSPQILLSADPGGNSSFLQVISWNQQSNTYNFFEFREQVGNLNGNTVDNTKVWSWAGNSAMAQIGQSMGHGCFDCHHNGVVIMKELTVPWNNWNSQLAAISPLVVPSLVAQEKFFDNLAGAEQFESAVRGGFMNYYRAWLKARFKTQGATTQLNDVDQMLRHIITNTTINLASSQIQSNGANTSPPKGDISGIPTDFFLWDSAFRSVLNLQYQLPPITIKRQDYDKYIKDHKFKLVQSDFKNQDNTPLYEQDGSTYFSFFTPVPAAEDLFMLTQIRNNKIVTDQFIAALLMVDFKNPVFSKTRSSLQKYADQIQAGTITNGVSSVPTDFAAKVKIAAAGQSNCELTKFDQCTAEQQFLTIWDLPEDKWQAFIVNQIQPYLNEFKTMATVDQVDHLMKSNLKRQTQFTSWPTIKNLNEFSLLLPQTDIKFPEPSSRNYSSQVGETR